MNSSHVASLVYFCQPSLEMSTVQYLSFGMLKVGVNETYELNWYLVLYYVVCILIAANLAGWLYNRGQVIGALISLALLLLIFIFFGLRWFNTPEKKAAAPSCKRDDNDSNAPLVCPPCPTFPPSINLCPDFMVAYTEPNGRVLCYDVNNTYEMKKATGAGLLTGLTINGVAGQSAHPSGLELINVIKQRPTELTNDTRGKYVRWEGVYTGRSMNLDSCDIECIKQKFAA